MVTELSKQTLINSCNIGTSTSGLPDMYTRGLRVQATSDHVTTTISVALSQSEFSCDCIHVYNVHVARYF